MKLGIHVQADYFAVNDLNMRTVYIHWFLFIGKIYIESKFLI